MSAQIPVAEVLLTLKMTLYLNFLWLLLIHIEIISSWVHSIGVLFLETILVVDCLTDFIFEIIHVLLFLINVSSSSIVKRLLEFFLSDGTLFHITLERLQRVVCSQSSFLLIVRIVIYMWSLPKFHALQVYRGEINRFIDPFIVILVFYRTVAPNRSYILFNFGLRHIRNIWDDISIQVGRLILISAVDEALHYPIVVIFSMQCHLHKVLRSSLNWTLLNKVYWLLMVAKVSVVRLWVGQTWWKSGGS